MKIIEVIIREQATAGATSAGSIATVVSPHIAIGKDRFKKSYHVSPGKWIGMAQPLWGDDVEYIDGTEATIDQQAKDVAAFLMWAAEPKLNARKEFGFTAASYLIVLAILLYFTNKKIWANVKRKQV